MEIGLLIKKISNQMETGRNEKLKRDGLTGTQLDLMIWMAGRDGAVTSQKDIGDYFGIRHTTTIQLLKKLEEKQFIYREVNSENARYRDVYLTEKGKDKVAEVKEHTAYIKQQIYRGISRPEQEELSRLLNVIYRNLQNGIEDRSR